MSGRKESVVSSQDGSEKPQNPFALPPELIEALLPNSSAVAVAQGITIFRQADACRGAFILQSGRCRLSIQAANGVEVYSRILTPGCILGLPATLCGEVYNTSAVAIDSCELACIDVQSFQEFVRTSPDLSIAIVQAMSRELADMNVRRANLHACKSCGCPLAETCSHHLYDLK
jgi:CRP-like cAMP-binding protein